jgi:hypothetical protein
VLGPPAHRGSRLAAGVWYKHKHLDGQFPRPCKGCGLGVSNRTNFTYNQILTNSWVSVSDRSSAWPAGLYEMEGG